MEIQCPTAERLLNEDLEVKPWVRLGDKDINNVFRQFFRPQRIFEVVEGNRDLPSSTSAIPGLATYLYVDLRIPIGPVFPV
jgi:hypothetical protein